MTQQLTKMEIDRVDLVDAGANGRRFALFKRDPAADGSDDEQDARGLASRIGAAVAKALGIPQAVEKAMTFAQIVAGREISNALEDNWWVLQDALWSAIYAVDDDGSDLSLDAKKALVAQNLDEFKAFLLEHMDAGVTKSDRPAPGRLVEALVAKVGRKISGARMAQLSDARDALVAVLAEVEDADEAAETEKRATAQEEDMTPEELAAAIQKGNEPLVARIEALEKAKADGDGAEGEPADGEATLDTVVEAITKLAGRVEAVEKGRGTRQSSTDEPTPVKKSTWAGVLS